MKLIQIVFVLFVIFTIVVCQSPKPLSQSSPPNNIWGIFQDNNDNFNITNYNLINNQITNYPIPPFYGEIFGFVSLNSTTTTLICGDEVSMSIIQMDLITLEIETLQTIAYSNSSSIYIIPGSYAYNPQTQVLIATGYEQHSKNQNITIFSWDFQNTFFSNMGISGEDISTDHQSAAVYDQLNTVYYVNIYDMKYNDDMIYCYNTSNTNYDDNIYIVLENVSKNEILFLVQTIDGTLYGISNDDDNFIMIYKINIKTGEVSLFYHTKSVLIATAFPVVAFNEYLLIISNSGEVDENTLTILNTVNLQTKILPIGNSKGDLPEMGGFFIATY